MNYREAKDQLRSKQNIMVAWIGTIIEMGGKKRLIRWYFEDKVLKVAVELNIRVKGKEGIKDVF